MSARSLLLLLALSGAVLAACQRGGDSTFDRTIDFTVLSTDPAAGSAGIDFAPAIRVTFSKSFDPATLDETSFRITQGSIPVPGIVSLIESSAEATFQPLEPLAFFETYTAVLSSSIEDTWGRPLPAHEWTFTTRDLAWTTPVAVSNTMGSASAPGLAVSENGTAIAVWTQYTGSRDDLWASRFVPGSGWSQAQLIESDDSESASSPHIAVDAAGNAIAVWSQAGVVAARFLASSGWQAPQTLEATGSDPSLAMAPNGNAMVLWGQSSGMWSRLFDTVSGWGTPRLIDSNTGGDPDIAFDEDGTAVAIWHRSFAPLSRGVYAANGGRLGWGLAQRLDDGSGRAGDAQIRIGASGEAVVAWNQIVGTLSTNLSSVWASRRLPGESWLGPELLESDDIGSHFSSRMAMDAAGNAIVVWQESIDGLSSVRRTRHAVGSGWEVPQLLENDDLESHFNPEIGLDSNGDGSTVWRSGNEFWSARLVGDTWQPRTLVLTAEQPEFQRVAFGADGRAVLVWREGTPLSRIMGMTLE